MSRKKVSLMIACMALLAVYNAQSMYSRPRSDILEDTEDKCTDAASAPFSFTPLYIPTIQSSASEKDKKTTPSLVTLKKLPGWIIDASIKNAPPLLKGILNYFQSLPECSLVPSFHRFILVGAPGTGKTTLAQAIGHQIGYTVHLIPATSFLSQYRNATPVNIRKFFDMLSATDPYKHRVVIIDELHKLFEGYDDERSDKSECATVFWLSLDKLEEKCPHIIVIGTANDVSKLPPEIKSRFHGKIITMSLPNKSQRISALKKSIEHDPSIVLDDAIDDTFINALIDRLDDCSLRDIKLLIDTAKMFCYTESGVTKKFFIKLYCRHLKNALIVLREKPKTMSWFSKNEVIIQRVSLITSIAFNIVSLLRNGIDTGKSISHYFDKNDTLPKNEK